jgi:hypothetical protein
MPNFYLAEYSNVGASDRGPISTIPCEPPISEQTIPIGFTNIQSEALLPETCIVKVQSEIPVQISIGTDPDATNSARTLAAGEAQLLAVAAGSKLKIAIVAKQGDNMNNNFDSLGSLLAMISNPKAAAEQVKILTAETTRLESAKRDLVGATSVAALQKEIDGRAHALAVATKDVEALRAELMGKLSAIKQLS